MRLSDSSTGSLQHSAVGDICGAMPTSTAWHGADLNEGANCCFKRKVGEMKTKFWWRIALTVGLLSMLSAATAKTRCGLNPGARVVLDVDHPSGHPTLFAGMEGTVICLDYYDPIWPVLVSWDHWWGGTNGIWWCSTTPLPWNIDSLWWMKCGEIKSYPWKTPNLTDAGEQDRYFAPRVLIAGQPNQSLEVGFRTINSGTGDVTNTVYVDVYISTDQEITDSDYYFGSTNCYLSAGGVFNLKVNRKLPTDIPPGLYYVGWIIDPEDKIENEYSESDNVACLTSYRLTLAVAEGIPSLQVAATPGGQIAAPGEGVFACDPEEVVTVEAQADPNCAFQRWIGSAVEAGKVADPLAAETNVTVDEQYTLTAFFDGPHLIVDDFESYEEPDNPLNNVWMDGLGYLPLEPQGHRGNNSCAVVGYAEAPTPGNPTVHGGTDAMIFGYDNNYNHMYSETERRWDAVQNWTETGANALSIWYRGAADNAAQPLYVALGDCYDVVAVVEHPAGPAAVQAEAWTHWTIPFSQFEDAGVMLSRTLTLYIGVGNRSNPKPGGGGLLYFDDITLVYEMTD